MKLEEIEKLNEKRTPGKWCRRTCYAYSDFLSDYELVASSAESFDSNPDYAYCGKPICSAGKEGVKDDPQIVDMDFIAAAPAMAEMLLRLKRFPITKKFRRKVLAALPRYVELYAYEAPFQAQDALRRIMKLIVEELEI